MALAGDTLYVAGHPDFIDERQAFRLPDDPDVQARLVKQAEALDGKWGGRLWAVSAADGKPLARYSLPMPPVFDGLAAADGRLFMSTLDGAVLCLGPGATTGLQPLDEAEPLQTISDEPEEPNYLKPPEVDKSADFGTVSGCRVVEAPLGYRVQAKSEKTVCLALNQPAAPLTGKVALSTKFRVQDGTGFLQNGFIAFGDGPTDAQLVKCGIRFRTQTALIIQDELLTAAKATNAKVDASMGKATDLTVTVDLDQQTVSFTTCGVTVEAKLARPLASITYVGFAADSAIVEVSPLQVGKP
jgi:hypothetical protein